MAEAINPKANKENGIIIAPVGGSMVQKIKKITYTGGKRKEEDKISCVFVNLYGKFGF